MVYEKKKLAIAKGVSIYRVERDAGLSNGAISKWGKTANQTPSSESLKSSKIFQSINGISTRR